MDENTRVHITLNDGKEFNAVADGCGNLIVTEGVTEEDLTIENLSSISVSENDGEAYELEHRILRGFRKRADGKYLVVIGEMTELELLKQQNEQLQETNDMLTECILEMSEIIYA